MERVENIATEGLGSYKEALAQAYEGELDGVENVVWSARARYRALRFALYQRRARRAEAKPVSAAAAKRMRLSLKPRVMRRPALRMQPALPGRPRQKPSKDG
jgi:hypothetical protein